MENFSFLSQSFLREFTGQQGATFHPDIEIQDLRSRNAGRGILAKADIPPGAELFTIPRSYVISVENSRLYQQIPSIFDEDIDDDVDEDEVDEASTSLPEPWLNLILVLIHDYIHRSSSKWQAYWNVLPHTFDTLMFWSEDELDTLQASAVRKHIGKDSANKMFQTRIIPVINKHKENFYGSESARLTQDDLLLLCHRMGSLIMAYAFDLENSPDESDEEGEDGWAEDREGQTAMGMVPMADMLNADAEFNAHLEHGADSLTMRSLRTIKQGEEVLNYYGPLPNCDLLRRYGYTSLKHARYDVVEISWAQVESTVRAIYGATGLQGTAGRSLMLEDMEDTFVLERESGDPDDTGINSFPAKFTDFPEELVEQTTTLIADLTLTSTTTKPNEQEKRRIKHTFLKVMAQVLVSRLAEYGTTLEHDADLMAEPSMGTTMSSRLRSAAQVRLGEKRLLKEAETMVRDLLQRKYSDLESAAQSIRKGNGAVGASDNTRAAKRQKRSK